MVQTACDSARTESDIHTKGSGGGRRKAICRQSYMDMAMWLKVSLSRARVAIRLSWFLYAIQRIVFRKVNFSILKVYTGYL